MISRLELPQSIFNTDTFRERFKFSAAQFQNQQKCVGFLPLKHYIRNSILSKISDQKAMSEESIDKKVIRPVCF